LCAMLLAAFEPALFERPTALIPPAGSGSRQIMLVPRQQRQVATRRVAECSTVH
jgi:hypothetical protein